jgi:hypothetical protein
MQLALKRLDSTIALVKVEFVLYLFLPAGPKDTFFGGPEGLPAFIPRALRATLWAFHRMATRKKGRLALKDMKDGKAPAADPLTALNTT